MLRGTMLFGKSSMRIGTKVSNRCSIIVLAFLYPSCYPSKELLFWKKMLCRFCVEFDSV